MQIPQVLRDVVRGARAALSGDHTLGQRANVLLHKLAPRTKWVPYQPTTLSIIATGRCNLACEMCPTHSRKVPKDFKYRQGETADMTLAMFKDLADRFKYATTVNFIGSGEPLMIDDFYAIVEYAARVRKMVIKSFSNGILIGEHAERLALSSLEGMNISVNSDNAEDFQRLTSMGARYFPRIIENTRILRQTIDRLKSPLRLKLSFVLDQQNYRRAGEMLKIAEEFRPFRIYFGNYLANPYAGMSADKRSLWDDPEVLDYFRGLEIPASLKRRVYLPDLLQRAPTKRGCTCHWDQMRFNGNGDVGSCSVMLLNSYIDGSYKDKGLFNNASFQEKRARFLSDTAPLESPCYHCPDNIGRKVFD
jgi:MoaA/NifB/PqqE/SkfB family radical SAM enzyme